jgi:hypothetical protein
MRSCLRLTHHITRYSATTLNIFRAAIAGAGTADWRRLLGGLYGLALGSIGLLSVAGPDAAQARRRRGQPEHVQGRV